MKIDTLGKRIGFGFALLVLLLALAVGLTIWQVASIGATAGRLVELREPTARGSLQLERGIGEALAALRGWLLTDDPTFKVERREAWSRDIHQPLERLERLSAEWTNPENQRRLNQIRPLVNQLEIHHQQIEDLALSDRQAAIARLAEHAVPLGRQINDVLEEMVADQRGLLRSDFDRIGEQITLLDWLEWLLMGLGLLVGLLFAVFTTRATVRPIAEAVAVANNIAAGRLDTEVEVGGARELEVLGRALTDMRDSLRVKTAETDRYAWLASGQNRLNEVVRGDQEVEELATGIVTFIATYAGASIGSLYLVDETTGELAMAGRYAFAGRVKKARFKLGEGMIGQAAADCKTLLLDDLDQYDIRVESSLLDVAPRQVLVVPFLFDSRVLGVLELGTIAVFDEQSREFVQANMEAVGVALNSAQARNRIAELLAETQQQSEELQQQQEELEQSNEELEEQTQLLREQQEELQAANEELEEQTRMVAEKNKDLEAARTNIELKAQQLEVSSKYKSEFLANMSHELRTPLNSLLILANDLAANGSGNLSAEQVESAQVISRSGHDLLSLINDILDLSKIEAGKMDLKVTALSIAEIAEDIQRTFARQTAEKGLRLEVEIDDSLPETIRSDRQRLEQVLRNLIANAVKFTDSGSVSVHFQRDAGDNLAIAVSDTGIGIAKDKHDLIFEAFLQAEGGTSRKYGGTGLGLSICRDLAKLLGGSIRVESEEGRGSTFTFTVPLTIDCERPAQVPEPVRKQVVSEPDRNRFLDYPTITDQRDSIAEGDNVILIIEDDDEFARVLASQAKAKGFKHINAATGEDGLVLAARFLPQAIILDLGLPGIDGHLVLAELKGNPDLRHIPVHIVSGNEKTLAPIKAGAVDYLTKPVSKEQLDSAFARMEDFISRKMKKLLIIEDDETMRKSIIKLIGNGDVQCCEAGTAAQALDILQSQTVDCLVIDIGLPDMSGFELIRRLDSEKSIRVPPIIVYTGRELTREESDELEQYAETVIVKGVKSEERLLDETALFLHRTLSKLPASKQQIITGLYDKEAQLRDKRVLLVDDDMRNVFALSKVLADRGMKVVKAENGRVALDLLAAEEAMDFVLMDIMMPEMDGYECMRELRKQPQFRDLPIVALTAKAMKEDRQKCIDAGANDYIAKPVDVDRLLSLMRIWMRK